MRLIILAAGYGGRLSPATDNIPKALLDLGGGITVLDLQLEAAAVCGIDSVSVVVGYEAEQIESKLAERSDLGLDTQSLYNPFFQTTNNMVSLWMARSVMSEDFIVLNGDDVFSVPVLQGLIDHDGEFTAVVARKSRYDADDTKMVLDGDRVSQIGKAIPVETVDADWVGMCKVSGSLREIYVASLDRRIRDRYYRDDPGGYLPFLQGLIDDGVHFGYHEILPESWAEIDFQMDLDFVRDHLTRFTTDPISGAD